MRPIKSKIANKYGNEFAVTSSEGVTYKINVTEIKKYLKASDVPDQQDTGGTVNDFRTNPEAN